MRLNRRRGYRHLANGTESENAKRDRQTDGRMDLSIALCPLIKGLHYGESVTMVNACL